MELNEGGGFLPNKSDRRVHSEHEVARKPWPQMSTAAAAAAAAVVNDLVPAVAASC